MAKKEPTLQDISKQLEGLLSQLQSLHTDVRHIKEELRRHGDRLEEIGEVLGAVSRAVDKDALTIIQYSKRLARMERSL